MVNLSLPQTATSPNSKVAFLPYNPHNLDGPRELLDDLRNGGGPDSDPSLSVITRTCRRQEIDFDLVDSTPDPTIAPNIFGTDLTNETNETISILGHKDLIKVNQDPHVGESISPIRWGINADYDSNSSFPAQCWSGNLSYSVLFMILNTEESAQKMFFNLTESWAIRAGRQYTVYDMWQHKDIGIVISNMTLQLPAHGVAALLLNDAGPEPALLDGSCAIYYQCLSPNGIYISN
ncbi:hypothetical protein KCU77_g395, partial [Aureobasidium melanogenum]